jgi:hypothetical protein
MPRKNLIVIALIAIVIAAGIWYFQSRLYSPPSTLPTQSIEDQLVSSGVAKDGIPSIDEPEFESVAAADEYLKDEGEGLVVKVAGGVRFYPYQILVWHEIVNDTFNGQSLVVTFCPLCHAGIVYDRDLGEGETLVFGTSGDLLDSNFVMYDRASESLFRQATGEAIVGERLGSNLEVYPSMVMLWSEFKRSFSSAKVLSRETGATRDYTYNPYERYLHSQEIWFPLSRMDDRLEAKTLVYGVAADGRIAAYTIEAWEALPEADRPDGAVRMYWFCWVALHPETEVYE